MSRRSDSGGHWERRHRAPGPSIRSVAGNVVSDLLPGGSLITAVLDRNLMAWSDRGGASRVFGDRWSEQCTDALHASIGTSRPVPGGVSYTLRGVVRLDDNPQIAIEAGRHKLVNPDFVLYGDRPDGTHVLQSADAKFAVDTIKSPQVSAEALDALLAVDGGLVGRAIEQALHGRLLQPLVVERGVFLSPIGPLTDYFLPRVTGGPRATVDPREVVLLPVDPVAMFAGLTMTPLIETLAPLDGLPVSPRENVLSAMYYFRLACACAWMWTEEHAPLLTASPPPEPDTARLSRETSERARGVVSAYDVVLAWSSDIEQLERSRQAMRHVAAVPVRMRELRDMVAAVGLEDHPGLLRRVRGALERRYRTRLVELVGEVPARPERPLPEILDDVAVATRKLYPELRDLAADLIDAAGPEGNGDPNQ
ncbi:MAG TPA: hypothetical protein VFN57_07095 [Thermomicrobiaceae bacterium]|nr:hypothetical protein [Thermomicrobiaceae bacterium]